MATSLLSSMLSAQTIAWASGPSISQSSGTLIVKNASDSQTLSLDASGNVTFAAAAAVQFSGRTKFAAGGDGSGAFTTAAGTNRVSWDTSGNTTLAGTLGCGAITSTSSVAAASASTLGISTDTLFYRNAANEFGMRGTTPVLSVANSGVDNGTNYERLQLKWSGNVASIGTVAGGTGTIREMRVASNGKISIVPTSGYNVELWHQSGAIQCYNGNSAYLTVGPTADTFGMRNSTTAQKFFVTTTYTNSSNYEQVALSTAAGSATLACESAGTGSSNIDLKLSPKGTGNVWFGTHTGVSDTAISGYITIKDSGGTTRKLAVIT